MCDLYHVLAINEAFFTPEQCKGIGVNVTLITLCTTRILTGM